MFKIFRKRTKQQPNGIILKGKNGEIFIPNIKTTIPSLYIHRENEDPIQIPTFLKNNQ